MKSRAFQFILILSLVSLWVSTLPAQPQWLPNGGDKLYTPRHFVGINFSDPLATLHVVDFGDIRPALLLEGADANEGDIAWGPAEALKFGQWNESDLSFVERMRISASGLVGIGTTSPLATLHIADLGTTRPALLLEGANSAEGDIAWKAGDAFQMGEWDETGTAFKERLRINSAGRVGIGAANPVAALHINGAPGDKRPALYVQDADGSEGDLTWKDGQHFQVGEWDENAQSFTEHLIIRNDGKVGIGTSAPSTTLDIAGELSFPNTPGDKVSLYDGRIGQNTMYGFGIEANTMYFKTNGWYRWYSHANADGGASASMVMTPGGRLGLGTNNPNHELVIQSSDPALILRDDGSENAPNAARIELLEKDGGNFNTGGFLFWNGKNNNLVFGAKNGGTNENIMVIGQAGLNVGIGTANPHPDYRLSVNGGIRAKEIVVEGGWADFVFEDGYPLKSIAEVAQFIEDHGHLPDVPSAEEIEANGIPLGAMQARLLQKIEELTLYTIDQEKRIEVLEKQVGQLIELLNQKNK